ncbi:sensor box histidine kinase [Natronomonas moolapensis 8.8.11]|uniref:Sensor box histidine kinase n=2 Tax=Halobacteriales TaxID=2235 RepID=M1XTS5_NATM8|nr:ATP-binding protein [Natronomonas moolapensis]CCQ37937.1 sensor box histidine kinase [Natronomonas moolapensis 8.8.11]
MAAGNPGETVVLYVGRGPALDPDGRFRLERVTVGSVAERATVADCVVLEEPGKGLAALERLRGTSVPTVLYDRSGDPAVAERATRLGVTEYVTDDGTARPIDRIAAVAGVSGPPPEDRRREAAMRSLRRAVADGSRPFEESIGAILEAGRERFDASYGVLAEIDGASYSVVTTAGGIDPEPTVLEGTLCRRTARLDGPCCLPDTGRALRSGDLIGVFDRLGSYVGATVHAGGDRYGTVWFGSESSRPAYSGSERRFLELLAGLVGKRIEADRWRQDRRASEDRHRRAVGALIEAGRSLRAAGTPAEIAEITAEIAERTADVEISAVRLFEDGAPVAAAADTGDAPERSESRPRRGDSSAGELVIGDGSGGAGGVTRSAAVALGERGALSVDDGAGSITESERRRLALLAALVEAALERLGDGAKSKRSDSVPDAETPSVGDAGRDRREGRFGHLFDALPDAVVDVEFVDAEPIVRRVNDAFEKTFGYDEADVIDTPLLEAIVPPEGSLELERPNGTDSRQRHETLEVERLTAEGRRTFLFRGFSYRHEGAERGFGIYTDVTGRLEQERRLRVLHRVLRHNLRNEMTAIIGYANILAEEAPMEEYRTQAERIYERAMNVSKLGEQVRRIQQALDIDRQWVALDPEPLVTDLAERFRSSHPEATIRVSSDDSGEAVADELLKIAIENLIENAIEHHPGTATVDIELTAEDGWIDITVADDGPGIPERERAVVSGAREITQLDHSVGLGLWLSRWIVSGVDGQLLFGDCECGSEVTLRLRRADGRDGV